MSACKAQALSQVGCRLMVASSANTSRPRLPPVAAGPSERTLSINASISGREEAGAGVCGERSLLIKAVYTKSKRAYFRWRHAAAGAMGLKVLLVAHDLFRLSFARRSGLR